MSRDTLIASFAPSSDGISSTLVRIVRLPFDRLVSPSSYVHYITIHTLVSYQMANRSQHRLEEIEIDRKRLKGTLRAVLQTIVFQRSLLVSEQVVTPKTRQADTVAYSCVGDPKIDKKSTFLSRRREDLSFFSPFCAVEDAISKFVSSTDDLKLVGPDLYKGRITLSFYETRERSPSLFRFSLESAEDKTNALTKVYWEQWMFTLLINVGRPLHDDDVHSEKLRVSLFEVLTFVNASGGEHLPPSNSNASKNTVGTVYPFDVDVGFSGEEGAKEGWLTKMLKSGPPALSGV